MRIEEFHIDGFGRFQSLSVTTLAPRLSIVLGNNEAGKSTLLAFLRSVLFGLPSRKQAEFYPPLRGGRHGGRVVLMNGEAERIVVERFAGKGSGSFTATFPDGSQLGEEQFRQRLGMVTGDVYEKVFAFGLGELQTFETLKDDNIRDAIYNAGIGTGGQSPAQVVKRLNEQCELLFKPGGSNPEMNQILKRLTERRLQIDGHAADQDEYQRIQDELQRTDRQSTEIGSELHRCRQRLARLHTLQQGRDDWILLVGVREQLQSVPRIESFPQAGVSRVDTLLNEQRHLRNQLREVADEHREAEQELMTIQVDETLLSLSTDIRRLERRVDLYDQNRQQLAAASTDRRLAEDQLKQNLQDLGQEWDAEKLRSFDLSFPAREELDVARQACEESQKQVEILATEVELRHKQLQECSEIEEDERKRREELAAPVANLDAAEIHRLGRNQTAYEAARRDLPRVQQECQDNESRLQETLRSINPDWTEERLDRYDDSLSARETLNVHQEKLGDLRSRTKQLSGRVEEGRLLVRDHQAAVNRDEALLASLPSCDAANESSLVDRKNRLRGLRSLLTQHAQLQTDLAHQAERKRDLEEQLARLKQDTEEVTAGIPRWLIPSFAVLGFLSLLVLGFARGEWVLGTVILVIAIVIAVLLYIVQRTAPSAAQRRRHQQALDRESISQRITDAESILLEFHNRDNELQQRIQPQLQSAGIATPLSAYPREPHAATGHVDEQEALIERQLDVIQQRRPIEQRLDDCRTQLKRARATSEDAQRNHAETQTNLNQAETDWRTWLKETELPETLSPEVAINVLSRLGSARELLKAVNDQRRRIHDMRNETEVYDQSVRSVAANCGIENLPAETLDAVQFLSNQLNEHDELVRNIREARDRVGEAEQRSAQAIERLNQARRLHETALARQQGANQQWIELLHHRGLRATLAVQHAEQMMQGIERARGQLTQVDNQKATEEALSEQNSAALNEVRSVAQQAGLSLPDADEISTCVGTLVIGLKQAEEDDRCRKTLRDTIQKSNERSKQLEGEIDELQREIDHLLAAAGTSDEEEFRQKAAHYDRLQSLANEIRVLETRLRQLAGGMDALAALERELQQSSPEVLQTEKRDFEEAIKDWEQKREQSVRLSEKLSLQLQQLGKSDELSSLRIQQETDLAEFRNLAREWTVLKIAAHMIDQAREKYERERRPAVLKQAERYFSRLTRGSYSEILAPAGNDPCVVAPDGSRKELHQLSRGTAEQLYLALRFGFVEEFLERSEPLTLIFDDILVNFDPYRAGAAAEAIVDLSRNHQILLFTCHPKTVQVLKDLDSEAAVFELQDGRLSDGSGAE